MADGPAFPALPGGTASDRDSDADFAAFFRSGEDGTYKGGPADSIAPVYADLELEDPDDAFYEAYAARQERRERYQRRVFQLVGALAASLVLGVAVRATSTSSSGEASTAAAPVRVTVQAPAAVVTDVPPPSAVDEPPTTEMPEVLVAANDPPVNEPKLLTAPVAVVPAPAAVPEHAAVPAPPAIAASAAVPHVPSAGAFPPVTAPTGPSPRASASPRSDVATPVAAIAAPARPRPQRPKPTPSSAPSPLPSLQSLRGLQVVSAPSTALFPN